MGIITREPEPLQRAVHREALLELKRLNDEYVQVLEHPTDTDTPQTPDPADLFHHHHLNPTDLYRDDILAPRNDAGSMAVTIAEPNQLDFYQYGLECRYLPLFRYLQLSKKAVLTEDWRVAREELLFSRAFDRCLELRQSRSLSTVVPKRPVEPQRTGVFPWDRVLQQARWMRVDVTEEREWTRALAKEVAEEAVLFLKLKFKLKRRPFHYSRDLLNYLDRDTTIYGDHLYDQNPTDVEAVREQLSQLQMQWTAQDDPPAPMATAAAAATQTPATCPDCTPHLDDTWTDDEDAFLKRAVAVYSAANYDLLADTLGRSADSIRHRMHVIAEMKAAEQGTEMSALRHHNLISFILSTSISSVSHSSTNSTSTTGTTSTQQQRTRPLHTASQAAKKLQSAASTVHPSHEAAVRKANQNINKLLTPGELALRRLQRNRVMTGELPSNNGGGSTVVGSGNNGQTAVLQPQPQQQQQPPAIDSQSSSTVPSNPQSPKK